MTTLTIHDEEFGAISVRINSRATRIIVRLRPDNSVVLTAPHKRHLKAAQEFFEASRLKLRSQKIRQSENKIIFQDGQQLGKSHMLHLESSARSTTTSRVTEHGIFVSYPARYNYDDPAVQQKVIASVKKAFRREAKLFLPLHLAERAKQRGLKYTEVRITSASSRWGSCTTAGTINLNLWLMLLPPELIDYVICHELCHLIEPNHSADFWREVATYLPNHKALRVQLKTYHPLG
jgi:predicted metal-dependent hydrolase